MAKPRAASREEVFPPLSAIRKKSLSWAPRLAAKRIWVQVAFLAIWLDPLMLRMHGICSPVFHCHSCPYALFACPIGVLAHFGALHMYPFVALGVLAATGALLGAFICGWICPFGFLQDLIGRIPTPKFTLPGWTGYFRYVVLVGLVLVVPYWLGEGSPWFFCSLCPAGAIEGAVPMVAQQAMAGGPIAWPSTVKLSILGVLLMAMLFTWRPWCAVLCPLGAMYSLSNAVSFFYVRVRKDDCNECGACRSLCRYGGSPRDRASDLRCIRCLDCTRCDAVGVASVFDRPAAKPEPAKDEPVNDEPLAVR
ncbi:MAG: 4Fe-4S binding protein [Pirellulales bacterium]|nr:4Fe-4S binding protein [Pirellulales bacterium]